LSNYLIFDKDFITYIYRGYCDTTTPHSFIEIKKAYAGVGFISGFLADIKLTDKSVYPDNGYPDMQTLGTYHWMIE